MQQRVAFVEERRGLIHHRQLRLLGKVLRAGGTAVQGELRAVVHAGGQQPVLVLLPGDLQREEEEREREREREEQV